jgi:hypothetical protein
MSSSSVSASAAVATPVRPSTAPSPSRLTPDEKVIGPMAVGDVLFSLLGLFDVLFIQTSRALSWQCVFVRRDPRSQAKLKLDSNARLAAR